MQILQKRYSRTLLKRAEEQQALRHPLPFSLFAQRFDNLLHPTLNLLSLRSFLGQLQYLLAKLLVSKGFGNDADC